MCFWDLQQHQSQYYLRQLAEQAQKLTQKDIIIIGIQSSKVDNQALQEWLRENKIPFIVSMIEKDVEETKFNWGVQTLPWLIITDKQHKVLGEGFSLDQVDTFIK